MAWLEDEDTARHPVRSIEAEVVATKLLTHDILRLRLKAAARRCTSRPASTPLELPDETSRDYSMANAPGAEEVEFHVRRLPRWANLGRHPRPPTCQLPVWLTGPRGTAHLRAGHTGPILAIAGGSGLAPILSILESAVAQGIRQPIRVYIDGRDERDFYGFDRLASLAAQYGDKTVTPVLSAPSAPTDRRTGFLHTVVRAYVLALDGWKCYTAGPPAMIDALTEVVLARDLHQEDLHADVFFTPTTASRSVEIAAAG